jgi:hypothetical protein
MRTILEGWFFSSYSAAREESNNGTLINIISQKTCCAYTLNHPFA